MTDRERLRDRLIRRALAAHLMGLLDHATLAAITPAHRTYQDMGRVVDALGVVEMAEALDATAGQKIGWACLVRAARRKVRGEPGERETER